jgi:acetate CoA/acetoacetate CoA-transferase alpha subunit
MAVEQIPDGSRVLVGGFYGIGTPHAIIDEIVRRGRRDLWIFALEGGSPHYGISKLLEAGCVRKLTTSWIGNNKDLIGTLVAGGTLALELNPQGTLIERIRCGGYGLGGVLTLAGLGTYVEEQGIGQRVTANGRDWLYHTPITADVCIVEAHRADRFGNLVFRGSQMNYANTACTAADLVIASVMLPIGEPGSIQPEDVHVPGIFVDGLVQTCGLQTEEPR